MSKYQLTLTRGAAIWEWQNPRRLGHLLAGWSYAPRGADAVKCFYDFLILRYREITKSFNRPVALAGKSLTSPDFFNCMGGEQENFKMPSGHDLE